MDDLLTLVDRYPTDCRPTQIEPLGNNGGMSGANFWRITAPRGTLILRRWPPEHPSPDRLQFIHDVIRHAASSVDFLPTPVETRDSQSFVNAADHLWELAPWMPGAADYELAPSDEKLHAAMTALAEFHNAAATFQPSPKIAATQRVAGPPAIPRRLKRLQELTPNQITKLADSITDRDWPELAPIARQFVAALPSAIPRAISHLESLANIALPIQPCLRDIWHDHVLFTSNQVTGIVDFGAVDIDTPATDIARLLGSLTGEPCQPFREQPIERLDSSDAWRKGLAAYSATRPLSQDESLAVSAINAVNPILAGCNWIQWVYINGRQFQSPQQIRTRFQRIAQQLSGQPPLAV